MTVFHIGERPDWHAWTTPKGLHEKPVHRWFVFPHSYTSELVHALADEWGLTRGDRILDPFAGAGTTLLAAKEKGIPAFGRDLSPLSIFVTRVKLAEYDRQHLGKTWRRLYEQIRRTEKKPVAGSYPDLVFKALPEDTLQTLEGIERAVKGLEAEESERNFFRLAVLGMIPRYSRAVATGGWLSWIEEQGTAAEIPADLTARVEAMLQDLEVSEFPCEVTWGAMLSDARKLPDKDGTYSAVITSPPYPNRHDYTRVFGVELMFAFLNWEETRALRYQSFHSHPEARPERPESGRYVEPQALADKIERMKSLNPDARVLEMLKGYFLDMYLSLIEVKRVCSEGARIAFVLGNARYYGESVPVDEITAEIGEQTGLECERIIATRYRGNSAQQMGKYGCEPSRESVVVFRVPDA